MVQHLYPGVYVTEVPFHARPIEGVATSTAEAGAAHGGEFSAQVPTAPDWTQHNGHDPGLTMMQLLSWLGESSTFRMGSNPIAPIAHASIGTGVARGLKVTTDDADGTPEIKVSRGLAVAPDGRCVATESATGIHHVKKP
jgi:hypothetical protein